MDAVEAGFLMIPPLALCIIVIVANIIMVAAVRRKRQNLKSANFLFICNGLCNMATSFSMILRFMLQKFVWDDSSVLPSVFASVTAFLSYIQLIVTLSLAYDRYIAVAKPIIYRSGVTFAQVKKQLFLGSIVCLALIVPFSFCSLMYDFSKVFDIFLAVSRLAGAVIFIVVYVNIFKQFKRNALGVAASNDVQRIQGNATREALRSIEEKRLQHVCFSISASFFLLNLPALIYKLFFKASTDMQTASGKMLLLSITALLLNMTLDPIFYFHAVKRQSRRLQQSSEETTSRLPQLVAQGR